MVFMKIKIFRGWVCALISTFLLVLATAANADEHEVSIHLKFTPDLENGKRVYEICASCHLPDGWGNRDGTYPQLAGQHENVLVEQILEIRSGERDNPLMYPFVQERTIGGYQNLADVVGYIATLPMTPENNKGPWPNFTKEYNKGKALYEANCVSCHGLSGEGSNQLGYPRLQGQHYAYMMRQAKMVQKGLRKVDPAMLAVVQHLNQEDLELVINYVSYLPVPDRDLAPIKDQ